VFSVKIAKIISAFCAYNIEKLLTKGKKIN